MDYRADLVDRLGTALRPLNCRRFRHAGIHPDSACFHSDAPPRSRPSSPAELKGQRHFHVVPRKAPRASLPGRGGPDCISASTVLTPEHRAPLARVEPDLRLPTIRGRKNQKCCNLRREHRGRRLVSAFAGSRAPTGVRATRGRPGARFVPGDRTPSFGASVTAPEERADEREDHRDRGDCKYGNQ